MKFASAGIFAAVLLVLAAGRATAADTPQQRALYAPASILGFFTKEMVAALNITPEQKKGLEAREKRQGAIWQQHVADGVKVRQSKLTEAEKDARLRTLETQVGNDLFKLYGESLRPEQIKRMKQIILQVRGMDLFDFPEIQNALKIDNKDVKALRAVYDKMAQEVRTKVRADVNAKKITQKEAAQKSDDLTFSVPDRVRQALNPDQRKVLDDLLGEKFIYQK